MRVIKNRTRKMQRYHEDLGYLRRVKLYTRNRLNIISNKIYLLKEHVNRLVTRTENSTKEIRQKIAPVKYKALKLAYLIGNFIYRKKIKKKKVDKEKRAEEFMVEFLRNKLFRTIYKNLKVRHFKTLYQTQKGNISSMHQVLETRIDVILVRSGLAIDIDEARHMLNMQIIEIDRQKVTHYSRTVKIGELITLKKGPLRTALIKKRLHKYVKERDYQRGIRRKKKQDKSFLYPKGRFYDLMKRKRLKLKTYRPKVPNYLETNFPLFATTLLYLPESEEITYPLIIEKKEIKRFLTGIPLFQRFGK